VTCYAIKLTAGGWVALRDGGAVRHVDTPEEAYQCTFMVTALGIAENHLELPEGSYTIEPVEERPSRSGR